MNYLGEEVIECLMCNFSSCSHKRQFSSYKGQVIGVMVMNDWNLNSR